VRELKPAPSVSLLDTDIQVDVQIPAPKDEELSLIPRRIFIDQNPLTIKVDENQSLFFSFSIPSSFPPPNPPSSSSVTISHPSGVADLISRESMVDLLRSGKVDLCVKLLLLDHPDVPPRGTDFKSVLIPSANLFVSSGGSILRPSTHDHIWGSYKSVVNVRSFSFLFLFSLFPVFGVLTMTKRK